MMNPLVELGLDGLDAAVERLGIDTRVEAVLKPEDELQSKITDFHYEVLEQ